MPVDVLEVVGIAMAVMFATWLVIMSRASKSLNPKEDWISRDRRSRGIDVVPRPRPIDSGYPRYNVTFDMARQQREWEWDMVALALWMAFFAALMVFLPR